MRMILLAGAALLSACGGNDTQTNEANALATDDMMTDPNLMMDPNMMMDPTMNGTANIGTGATDPATQNLMQQDANTNDPDTNLANGL